MTESSGSTYTLVPVDGSGGRMTGTQWLIVAGVVVIAMAIAALVTWLLVRDGGSTPSSSSSSSPSSTAGTSGGGGGGAFLPLARAPPSRTSSASAGLVGRPALCTTDADCIGAGQRCGADGRCTSMPRYGLPQATDTRTGCIFGFGTWEWDAGSREWVCRCANPAVYDGKRGCSPRLQDTLCAGTTAPGPQTTGFLRVGDVGGLARNMIVGGWNASDPVLISQTTKDYGVPEPIASPVCPTPANVTATLGLPPTAAS